MPGTLVSIGSVPVDWRRPAIRPSSSPTSHGIRPVSLSGAFDIEAIEILGELFANEARQETVGGFTGVKEWWVFSGDVLGLFTGWYITMSFDPSYEREWFFGTRGTSSFMPFSMTAAYLGDLE